MADENEVPAIVQEIERAFESRRSSERERAARWLVNGGRLLSGDDFEEVVRGFVWLTAEDRKYLRGYLLEEAA